MFHQYTKGHLGNKKLCWKAIVDNHCDRQRPCTPTARGEYGIKPITILARITNAYNNPKPPPVLNHAQMKNAAACASRFLTLWKTNFKNGNVVTPNHQPSNKRVQPAPAPVAPPVTSNSSNTSLDNVAFPGKSLSPGYRPPTRTCDHCYYSHPVTDPCVCQTEKSLKVARAIQKRDPNFKICPGKTGPRCDCHANRYILEGNRHILQLGIDDGLISIPSSTPVAAPAATPGTLLTADDMLRHEQWLYDMFIVDKDPTKYPPRP